MAKKTESAKTDEKREFTFSTWERIMLDTRIIAQGRGSLSEVLMARELRLDLQLSDDEKAEIGYREISPGQAIWFKEAPVVLEFTERMVSFIRRNLDLIITTESIDLHENFFGLLEKFYAIEELAEMAEEQEERRAEREAKAAEKKDKVLAEKAERKKVLEKKNE